MALSDGQQPGAPPHAGGSLNAAISDVVVRITADYIGRGPTRARTTINGDWIFVTLIDTLTKGERTLAQNGRAEWVRDTRRAFQEAMRDDFIAEVEALTGRRVAAFLSDNHIDPDVAIEAFHLVPAGDDATTESVDGGASGRRAAPAHSTS